MKRYVIEFEAPEDQRDLILSETLVDLITDGYREGQYDTDEGRASWSIREEETK